MGPTVLDDEFIICKFKERSSMMTHHCTVYHTQRIIPFSMPLLMIRNSQNQKQKHKTRGDKNDDKEMSHALILSTVSKLL